MSKRALFSECLLLNTLRSFFGLKKTVGKTDIELKF